MKHTNIAIMVALLLVGLFGSHCSSGETPQTQPQIQAPESEPEPIQSDARDQDAASEEAEETPANLMEQALEAYQDALAAWDQGDKDSALTALDQAYSLIIKLDVAQDSPQFQEKNDLRLMIAQRIQEIYASHLSTIPNNHNTIPLTENKYVQAEIESFQTKERKFFLEAYQRSGRYRPMILEELKKAGLPEQLSWIPMIESWFKVRAYSRARALGLWQFISSTGYRFGLKRDRWVDERMDPEKSTRAAVKYLHELHALFGDWTTALAAYNCGEFQVQRVIRAQRINYLDNFWDLFVMLPRETARFVPRFIATLLIIQDAHKYGFELTEPEPILQYEIVSINRPVKLSSLAAKLGLTKDELAALNPELRHDATPDRDYLLKVPQGTSKQALALVAQLSRWIPPQATYVIHYVRRGETVSGIARRYRTSVSAIARMNRLRRNYMIRPGQRLKIPSRYGRSYRPYRPGSSLSSTSSIPQTKKPDNAVAYTVQPGDSPYTIAQKFGMQLKRLLSINGLRSRSRIYPGQKLWIIPKD